jgi:starch-binding outer membrane protein, SusD/RagB family
MKQLTNLLTAFALLFAMLSCENKMDLIPQGSPSSANFWKTADDAKAGTNAIYSLYNDDFMYGRGFFWLNNASDDIVTKGGRANAERIRNFLVDGSESDTKFIWALHYEVMKRCNDVISNVPKISMDQKLKNRMLGEAYFNHAVMHLELAYRYGDNRAGIPIQNRQDPSDVYIPRTANVGVNYEYIANDLKTAADLLPFFNELSPDNYGRAHKTAAWAYLARTYLYAKDWDNAKKYADLVINSGKHQLLPNFEDVFKIKNNWSSEYIWSVTSAAFNTGMGSIFPGVCLEDKGWGVYNGWGNFYPTKDLLETYQVGDKRLKATILQSGDKFMFFGVERTFNEGNSIPSASNRTGLMFNKYMEPFSYPKTATGSIDIRYVNSNGDKPSTALNVPLLRYADLILMKAEAKLMKGENADAEINMIRNRAGLVAISGATITDLKRERRCELAGEWADRHFDLVRWGDAQATYAKSIYSTKKDDTGNYILLYSGRNFDPAKHHVWPIPPDEIAASRGTLKPNLW